MDQRFKQLEDQVASLADLVKEGNASKHFPPLQHPANVHPEPHPPLPHRAAVRPPFPAAVTAVSGATASSPAIQDLIRSAKCVVGIGPMKQKYYDKFGDIDPSEQVRLAAIEALRVYLNIKENEIDENDIANTFLPKSEPRIPRVYIRFHKQEHADLCFKVAKRLIKSKAKVFHYFPRQFQDRVWSLEEVAYPLRRTVPPYKTEVVYTEDDVQLIICPKDQFRYYPHYVPNLPPIDMTPLRSPPKGTMSPCPKSKRDRFSDPESSQDERKSSRILSPPKSPTKASESDARNEQPDPSRPNSTLANQEGTDHANQEGAVSESVDQSPPVPQFLNDLGGYTNIQSLSPSTGKVSFDFKQPVNLRRASLNY